MSLVIRSNDSVICVSGSDAKTFLQGQLTCDLEKLAEQSSQLGAHCNPQGRIISLFNIMPLDGSYYLSMPDDLIPIAIAALKKYAVFFKITIRELSKAEREQLNITTDATKNHRDITAGIPAIYASTSGKYLPHEINLPLLGGISFEKGCYTGQEIIARMHYRGKLKSKFSHANLICHDLHRGQDIFVQGSGNTAGSVVDFYTPNQREYEALIIMDADITTSAHLYTETDPNVFFTIK